MKIRSKVVWSQTHALKSRAGIAGVSAVHIQNNNIQTIVSLEVSMCIIHGYMKIVICIFTWGLNAGSVASCVMRELAELPHSLDNNEMIQSLIWRMKKLAGWETACVGIFVNGFGLKGANIFPWHDPFRFSLEINTLTHSLFTPQGSQFVEDMLFNDKFVV